MAQQPPILKLTTFVPDRPQIELDGKLFDLKVWDDLSLADQIRLGAWWQELLEIESQALAAAQAETEDVTPEQDQRHKEIVGLICGKVFPDSKDLSLTFEQRGSVVQSFFFVRLKTRPDMRTLEWALETLKPTLSTLSGSPRNSNTTGRKRTRKAG